jgi:hypothetical protein
MSPKFCIHRGGLGEPKMNKKSLSIEKGRGLLQKTVMLFWLVNPVKITSARTATHTFSYF